MRLRDYYGERVRVTLNGFRVDPESGDRTRIYIRRVAQLDGYASMFGPGSIYGTALRVVRDKASKAELVISSLTIELAGSSDEDEEHGFEE